MEKAENAGALRDKIPQLYTFSQALHRVLRGEYPRLSIEFEDADGKLYDCTIYSCQAYFRADFKLKKA